MPDSKQSEIFCKPGATIEKLIEQLSSTRKKGNVHDDYVTDVLVNVGPNNLPHNIPITLTNKLVKVLHMAKQMHVNAQVYFSPFIPKHNNTNGVQQNNWNNICL